MLKTPYEAYACKYYHKYSDIALALSQAAIADTLHEATILDRKVPVRFVTNRDPKIPVFNHPITVEARTTGRLTVGDGRSFITLTRDGSEHVQKTQYDFNAIRCLLQHKWTEDSAPLFAAVSILPTRVFARWVAQTLTRKLALPVETVSKVTVLVGFYYLSLFNDLTHYSSLDKTKIAIQLSKALYINANEVEKILEDINTVPHNIHDLAALLSAHSGTARAEKLTPALLYTLIGNIWYGGSGSEITAVALEYPPTWLAMLYMAVNERGRFTFFGKMVNDWVKGTDLADNFSYNLVNLL